MRPISTIILLLAILFCSCILLLCSCSTKEAASPEGTVLTYVGQTDSIDAMTFLEPQQPFTIEMTDESAIKRISRVVNTGATYYILDSGKYKIIAIDSHGKVKHVIDAVGGGPLEYTRVMDIAWDNKKNRLLILSHHKLLYADSTGKIFESHDLKTYYDYVASTANGIVLANTADVNKKKAAYALTLMDSEDNMIEELPAIEDYAPYCRVNGPSLAKCGTKTIFTRKFDNKIYFVNDTAANVAYEIDWQGHEFIPEKGSEYDCSQLFNETREKQQVYSMSDFQVGDKYIFFRTNLSGYMLVDKESGDIKQLNRIYDREKGLVGLPTYIPASGKGSMAFFVYPAEYFMMYAEHSKSEWIKNMAKGITEDSNPVIFPYKLK